MSQIQKSIVELEELTIELLSLKNYTDKSSKINYLFKLLELTEKEQILYNRFVLLEDNRSEIIKRKLILRGMLPDANVVDYYEHIIGSIKWELTRLTASKID